MQEQITPEKTTQEQIDELLETLKSYEDEKGKLENRYTELLSLQQDNPKSSEIHELQTLPAMRADLDVKIQLIKMKLDDLKTKL